ncbi:MAG: helix-turn-helix domain-containing protein, partial [Acidobacteria bacterium]|nr:helix-turn-helix domain-containing protein [Acidobacteriota bacterium]
MSYGHADNLARSGAKPGEQTPPADPPEPTTTAQLGGSPPVPPGWYARPELAPVLIGHDVGALFRALNDVGVSQRRIAALTGTTQPQVTDIVTGRRARVQAYQVLVRIAEGLGIPRERMGLSFWGTDGQWYGPAGAYAGRAWSPNTPKEVSPAMLRRHLIALGGIVMAGAPVAKLGQLLDDLGSVSPVPLPSQLSHVDVVRVRDVTGRLAEAGNRCLCDPQTLSDAAARVSRLLDVPGTDEVLRSLQVAIAELRIEAGWAALDAGLYRHALYHFAQALELATEAGDAYCQAIALRYAGVASAEYGHPDEGLKMLQS